MTALILRLDTTEITISCSIDLYVEKDIFYIKDKIMDAE